MYNFTSHWGYAAGFALHHLFCLTFLLGVIFFAYWAMKNLGKKELKKMAITLLIVGGLGALLTMSFGFLYGHHSYKGMGFEGKGPGMYGCMMDDDCHEEMEDLMMKKGFVK